MSKAMDDVLAERRRQIEAEGWTAKHDDRHDKGQMALAAACYACNAATWLQHGHADVLRADYAALSQPGFRWPWEKEWWKPKDERRDLVRAAALLIAEIERLDRATGMPATESAPPTMINTPQQCKAAFEWLREQATKADANPLAGVALDEWHALATATLAPPIDPMQTRDNQAFSDALSEIEARGKRIGELERNYQEAREECTALRMGWDECIREKNKQRSSIAAQIAAIRYALQTDGEGLTFLRCWMHGEFPEIRAEWPDAPEAVFLGADPLYKAPPPVWQRDDEQTYCTLLLIGGHYVTMEAVASWSDEECQQAEQWAMAIHLQASDNDDVEVPRTPDCVRPYLERQHG